MDVAIADNKMTDLYPKGEQSLLFLCSVVDKSTSIEMKRSDMIG